MEMDNDACDQPERMNPPGLSTDEYDATLSTRVGEQYQAEIPQLMTRSEYANPETESSFLLGLPITLTQISGEASSSREHSRLVPGSTSCRWNDLEEDGFLLGLYIFAKSLANVKKLLQTKSMEEIQLFYYGRFYKSLRYKRWSEGCRSRTRRCVSGQKIFSGWRQQELLSRLLSPLPEEEKSAVEEVFTKHGEGQLTFHEFVNELKNMVGLKALIDGVGIGKGKQDLTSVANGHVKARPELPLGKDMNSLSSSEVVSFLTGSFRLSKTRCNDLFWDVIWPRLLDRGWHSEQPKDFFTAANSQSLVFLTPGVKKFSKRKHLKGDHYYDSIADILNKVASDPSLIEPDQHRHCYLNPLSSILHLEFSDNDSSRDEDDTTAAKEMPVARTWFDLNVPPSADECETYDGGDDGKTTSCNGPERNEDVNSKRHLKRNRPPTAKALEALADGYLTTTNKRKWKDDFLEKGNIKTARRPRRISESINGTFPTYSDLKKRGTSYDQS